MRGIAGLVLAFSVGGFHADPARADVFTTGSFTIYQYSDDGAYKRSVAGSEEWVSATVGPDGNVYAVSNILGSGSIIRIDPATGQFTEVVPFDPTASPTYTMPLGLAFRSDGALFAGSNQFSPNFGTHGVLRFDRASGRMEPFAAPADPQRLVTDIAFGPDDNLYVAIENQGIVRVDGRTGQTLDDLPTPWAAFNFGYGNSRMTFGPDGSLYLSDTANNIHRVDPANPDAHDLFILATSGVAHSVDGMDFGADGNLYIASGDTRQILRFDGTTGAFQGIFTSDARTIRPYRWDIAHVPEPASITVAVLATLLLRHRPPLKRGAKHFIRTPATVHPYNPCYSS